LAQSGEHDAPALIDEVANLAAVVSEIVVRFEDAVVDPS
jgi:hypothetical protein